MNTGKLKAGARAFLIFALAVSTLSVCDHLALTQQGLSPREGSDKATDKPPSLEGRDCYGDPLPEDAFARLGTLRLRHGGEVEAVALSPDGSLVASADSGSVVRVWEAGSGKEVLDFAEKIRASAVAFSADGKKIIAVSCPGITIQEWDVKKAILLRETKSSDEPEWHVTRACIAPHQQFVVATDPGGFLCGLYDTKSGKRLLRLKKNGAFVSCAVSHDGKSLATGGRDKTVRIWDIASGKELRQIPLSDPWVWGMQFSPSDGTLAVAGRTSLYIYEMAGGKEVFNAKDVSAGQPVYSPDGKTLVTGSGDLLHVWDTTAWKETRVFKSAPRGEIGHLAISADGKRIVSAGRDHSVQVLNLATGKEVVPLCGHRRAILGLSFSPDGETIVSRGVDGSICLWNCKTGQLRNCIGSQGSSILCAAVSPDGKTFATGEGLREGGSDEQAKVGIWDVSTGTLLREFPAHRNAVYEVAYSPDGRTLVSGGRDEKICMWDPRTGKERKQILSSERESQVSTLSFSSDGKTLVVGFDQGGVICYRVETGKPIGVFHTSPKTVLATLLPDGKRIVTAIDGREGAVQVSSLTGKVTERKTFRFTRLKSCAVSPNGRLLAIAQDKQPVRVWDLESEKPILELPGHRGDVTALAFSADSAVLASGASDTTVLLWNLSEAMLNQRWRDLASESDTIRKRAIDTFVATPKESVPYLARRLKAAAMLEARVVRLVKLLDEDDFEARERSSQELFDLGPEAEFALRHIIILHPSAEVHKRLEEVIDRLNRAARPTPIVPVVPITKQEVEAMLSGKTPPPTREITPGIRHENAIQQALDVLALVRTPEARQILSSLADGDASSWFIRHAKLSLQGSEKQRGAP